MMGFMIPTFIMSWFIVNTAATAAMLPLMEAVLDQLDPDSQPYSLKKVTAKDLKETPLESRAPTTRKSSMIRCEKINTVINKTS